MSVGSRILCSFGAVAPAWLLLGVAISGSLYPGFSHYNQAMSELHAVGSPIEKMAPLINHYPLTILFVGFGLFVYRYFFTRAAKLSGLLIIFHGLATLSAGYFPCDAGCLPEDGSLSNTIHGISGAVLFITLLIAPGLWAFFSKNEQPATWFGYASMLCLVLQLILMPFLADTLESGSGFGAYQRLLYAIPMLWMFAFSILLLTSETNTAQVSVQHAP